MRRHALASIAACFTLAACSSRAPRETAHVPASWRYANVAPPVVAEHAMVVSEHPIASRIGADVMQRGGNSIDAAVAVSFTLAVVHPRAGNIGGGGFLVYRAASGEVAALDYRETAPAAATRDMFLDSAGNLTERSVIGPLAAGVPGVVAGLAAMHARYGHLPWRDLVIPAVELARQGFVVDSVRALTYAEQAPKLRRFPYTASLYLPGGQPPAPGDTLRQPDLARTLQLIADSGAPSFYGGRVADLIVAQMRRSGGLITHADLAAYRAKWREPIQGSYRGWGIISMPPSSSGGVTLVEILNILEGYRRLPPFGSAALIHLETEAMRRAFTDRNRHLGDPDFVEMPIARLTSKVYAAQLQRSIARSRATPSAELPAAIDSRETTHFSIVDPEGNAVAVTTTPNSFFGSKVAVTGAGFVLNNTMDDFAATPGAPNQFGLVQGEVNAIAPGKRPLSAMTPTIVTDPHGHLALVLGSPGGPRIISAVCQVISNVIDHGMTLAQAVSAPRIHHQGLPDSLLWEQGGLPPEARRELEAMGHQFHQHPETLGDVSAIRVTKSGLEGVADPRRGGGAAGN